MIDSFVEELDRLGATAVLGVVLDQYLSSQAATLDREQSDALVELCLNHRVGAILLEAVAQGRVILAEPAVLRLREGVAFLLSTQLKVERGALAMIELLSADGIEFRVLKGMATAYLDYPNPAFRSFGDVDLLVRPRDVPRMMRSLEESGRGSFHTIRGNDWQIQHAVTFDIDGIEVDLHHRLLHQAAGHRVAKLDLFADPEWYEIAGRLVAALPPWLRLLQASSQNVLADRDGRKLSSDLDTAVIANRRVVARSETEAKRAGLTWVLVQGRLISASQFQAAEARLVKLPLAMSAIDRAFESTYESGERAIVKAALLEVVFAPLGLGIRIVRSILRPGDKYLSGRGRTFSEHVRRQLSRAVSRSSADAQPS